MSLLTISVINDENARESLMVSEYPKLCPICHHNISPTYIGGIVQRNHKNVQSAFRCPNSRCEKLFITEYHSTDEFTFQIGSSYPVFAKPITFSDIINQISPLFVEIINQANAAEAQNLLQISGMGLRKSLEFLVKDYAVSIYPHCEEEIKSSFLRDCINNFLDDFKIKHCAKMASWLGNDETHYVRKWEDKDINDLKILIKLTVNWIESAVLTEQYIGDLIGSPDNKKPSGKQLPDPVP